MSHKFALIGGDNIRTSISEYRRLWRSAALLLLNLTLLRSDTPTQHQSDQRHRSNFVPTPGQNDDTNRVFLEIHTRKWSPTRTNTAGDTFCQKFCNHVGESLRDSQQSASRRDAATCVISMPPASFVTALSILHPLPFPELRATQNEGETAGSGAYRAAYFLSGMLR